MIGNLMGICILGMFLVGILFPLGLLIYLTVIFIKEEINRDNVHYFMGLLIGTVILISFALLWYFYV